MCACSSLTLSASLPQASIFLFSAVFLLFFVCLLACLLVLSFPVLGKVIQKDWTAALHLVQSFVYRQNAITRDRV